MCGQLSIRIPTRHIVPLAMLASAIALYLAAPGPFTELNDRVTKLRYAYRVRAPGAVGGDGRLQISTLHRPQTAPGPTADARIPRDGQLESLCIHPRNDLVFKPPFHVRLRVRGHEPSAVRLYFATRGASPVYLPLDPNGDLPSRAIVESDEGLGIQALGLLAPESSLSRVRGESYFDYSIHFARDWITVSSRGETRTIPTPGSLESAPIVLFPVVGRSRSILDEFEIESDTTSASARATLRLRPLLYPFDLETSLGDRGSVFLVVSHLLLATLALAFGWLRGLVLRGLPMLRTQYSVGLLSLPLQILVLSAARACLGLAMLSFWVVAATALIHEIYGLRRIRPRAKNFVLRPGRAILSIAAATCYLCLVIHAANYQIFSLEEFPWAWGAIAVAAIPVFVSWRCWADRRTWLLPTVTLLAQCLLFAPLKVFQPAVSPITFYTLVSVPWFLTYLHNGATVLASRRAPTWLLGLIAPLALIAAIEVAVRGDHHLNHVTNASVIANQVANTDVQRVLDLEQQVNSATGKGSSIVIAGSRFPLDKPEGQFRIVCLGSSTTFGVGVESHEHSYPQQLGAILRSASSTDVVTVNAGVAGARLSFLEFFLERVLMALEPDVVILYFGNNADQPRAAEELDRLGRWLDHQSTGPTNEEIWAASQLRWPHTWLVRGLTLAMSSRAFCWTLVNLHNAQAVAGMTPTITDPSVLHQWLLGEWQRGAGSAHDIVELCRQQEVPILLVPEIVRDEDDSRCLLNPLECRHVYYNIFEVMADQAAGDGVHFGSVLPDFPPDVRQERCLDPVHLMRVRIRGSKSA